LHCEQENDYINWQESPFYVNKTNRPWPANGKIRTGAVSTFGMGGTNVHMVVQSYSDEGDPHASGDQAPYYLLAFSAKTPESLTEKIKDLIGVLQNKEIYSNDLSQISYTLLNGRQHFNHRCAVVVQGWDDAIYVLKQVGSKEKLPNLFQGKVPRDFMGQKAIEQYIQDLLKRTQTTSGEPLKYQEILNVLADLYCQGYIIDWKQLFSDPKMKRIHLPTYPFAKERYWFQESHSIQKQYSIPENITPGETITSSLQDDLLFFDNLIDEVLENRINTDNATEKIKEKLGIL
jgi:acyl transferase domain-containing protein